MARIFVRHTVADYAAWRKVYDEFDTVRRSMGVTAHAVYRSLGNPNDVTIWHDMPTGDDAEAFIASEALRAAMVSAGVQGTPTVWITEEA
jgi:hypothetical protein